MEAASGSPSATRAIIVIKIIFKFFFWLQPKLTKMKTSHTFSNDFGNAICSNVTHRHLIVWLRVTSISTGIYNEGKLDVCGIQGSFFYLGYNLFSKQIDVKWQAVFLKNFQFCIFFLYFRLFWWVTKNLYCTCM